MKGISETKAKENNIKYGAIYKEYSTSSTTLEELGKRYNITKQRVWQIITRCKLGDGDYYQGVQVARNKWSELNALYSDFEEIVPAYNSWLVSQGIKTAKNNQTVIPHAGWDWKY